MLHYSARVDEKRALYQESLELSALVASVHDAEFPLRMISTVSALSRRLERIQGFSCVYVDSFQGLCR